MAKTKKIVEVVTTDGNNSKVGQEETRTVIGIVEAEKLQEAGWQLISCHLTPEGKEYKFRKE